MKGAEIRAQIKDIDELKTAALTFRQKYNCLPGDCNKATTYFPAATQPNKVTNGTGNGIISGAGNTTTNGGLSPIDTTYTVWDSWGVNSGFYFRSEWVGVFDHLAAAGMYGISQYDEQSWSALYPGIAYPKMKINSDGSDAHSAYTAFDYRQGGMILGYEPNYGYIPGGHKIRLGVSFNPSGVVNGVSFIGGLNPWEAQSLDQKIDDGRPFSGTVVVTNRLYLYKLPPSDTDTNICGIYASNQYRNESNIVMFSGKPRLRGCAVDINAGF